jgi:hypothetical protein
VLLCFTQWLGSDVQQALPSCLEAIHAITCINHHAVPHVSSWAWYVDGFNVEMYSYMNCSWLFPVKNSL